MEVQTVEEPRKDWGKALRLLLLGTFLDLAVLLGLVLAHVLSSVDALVPAIDLLGDLLAVLAITTLAWSLLLAWRTYARHRKTIALMVGITAAVLVAHLFIVGLPAANVSGTISGASGSSFNDGKISVTSELQGDTFNVTVTASGG
ncbi:MAG TPA: hypothetical protein VEB67_00990, partial [Nitrososphaerales archaeon]|nr:hypothetical protein [Nitrososphaerales archaeon]